MDTVPQSEATHVDRDMEARARAMKGVEAAAPFEPTLQSGTAPLPGRDVVSGFGAAMMVRVRFAGGEIPLWSLVAPLVILVALTAALGASAVSGARRPSGENAALASAAAPAGADEAVPAPTAAAETAAAPRAEAGAPRAEATGAADNAPVSSGPVKLPEDVTEYTAAQLLQIADRRSASELAAARELERALERDPGLIKEPRTLAEVRRLVDNPETARIVLRAIAALPAPVSADLLYELWTGTVEKNETTELARALLLSRDVRPKASPALSVALDLRAAERCEDAKALLPRAIQDGDRRSFPLVIKLQRRYGCGPNKRADCYACLRDGDELENAIKAVKERREPRAFSRR